VKKQKAGEGSQMEKMKLGKRGKQGARRQNRGGTIAMA